MAHFNWNKNYLIGIDSIDNQHKKLVEIINKLYEAINRGKTRTIIPEVSDELRQYTQYHFSYEEECMKKCKYTSLNKHIEEHVDLIIQLDEHLKVYNASEGFTSIKLLHFLKDWLIIHILEKDKQYVPMMKKAGIN